MSFCDSGIISHKQQLAGTGVTDGVGVSSERCRQNEVDKIAGRCDPQNKPESMNDESQDRSNPMLISWQNLATPWPKG